MHAFVPKTELNPEYRPGRLSTWAQSLRDLFDRARLRVVGIRTYALIGESGTGKSYHAHSIASLLNCRYLIDDGLLIREQRILAGKTAKNETSPLKAVRRAIFSDEEHARVVRQVIRQEKADRIMILGTSEKMTERICTRLGLPLPAKMVRIEEFAPPEQLQMARDSRMLQGRHVIPAPQVEVKKVFSHTIVASISHLFSSYRMHRHPPRALEKSIVQPGYHLGRISISESALESLIKVVVEQFETGVEVRQVRAGQGDGRMEVYAELAVGLKENLPDFLNHLQHTVFAKVRQITGMHVDRVDLNVVDVLDQSAAGREVPDSRWGSSKKRHRTFKVGNSRETGRKGEP